MWRHVLAVYLLIAFAAEAVVVTISDGAFLLCLRSETSIHPLPRGELADETIPDVAFPLLGKDSHLEPAISARGNRVRVHAGQYGMYSITAHVGAAIRGASCGVLHKEEPLADGICVGGHYKRHMLGNMDHYRIIPAHRAYRIVVIESDGGTRLVKTWPTEEAAMAHLRLLRQKAELVDRQMAPAPSEQDGRGKRRW